MQVNKKISDFFVFLLFDYMTRNVWNIQISLFKENISNIKSIKFIFVFQFSYIILGETHFHTREIPRSGSKAKDGEKKKKKKKEKKLNDGNNNGQLSNGAFM